MRERGSKSVKVEVVVESSVSERLSERARGDYRMGWISCGGIDGDCIGGYLYGEGKGIEITRCRISQLREYLF